MVGIVMKEDKEITKQDLQVLEKHINTTKLRLIDMQNQFNNTLAKIKGSIVIVFLVSIIIALIGGYYI
tara:strand:- start:986 stop:1189 length:204 start_codon:yes stop_codon:yes gene_type:complete